MKKNNLMSSVYRFIIVAIILYSIWSSVDVLGQQLMINMAIVLMFAIIFSVLWKNKITSYVEWFVILGIIFYFGGQSILFMLLVVPMIQLITYRLRSYEIALLSLSVLGVSQLTGYDITLSISLASAIFFSLILINVNFEKISKLESITKITKKENDDLKLEISKKNNQIEITSRLFFHKKILEEIENVKELLNRLIYSTYSMFNSDYVVFYFYKNGAYFKLGEKGEAKDFTAPMKMSLEKGKKIVFENNTLQMPISFQKQPWGVLLIHGKKIRLNDSTLSLNVPFEDKDFENLSMLIDSAMFRLKEIRSKERLQEAAYFDRLTNVPNRASLEKEVFKQKINKMNQSGEGLFVFMLDIDNFKSFNDTFGHEVGDRVLVHASRLATKVTEETEGKAAFGRWGGEEFLGFYLGTKEEALEHTEKLRSEIENYKFPQRQITVSIGVSEIDKRDIDLEKTIREADFALYESKENGRNQVTYFEEGMER